MNDKEKTIADKLLTQIEQANESNGSDKIQIGGDEQAINIRKYCEFIHAVSIRMDSETRQKQAG